MERITIEQALCERSRLEMKIYQLYQQTQDYNDWNHYQRIKGIKGLSERYHCIQRIRITREKHLINERIKVYLVDEELKEKDQPIFQQMKELNEVYNKITDSIEKVYASQIIKTSCGRITVILASFLCTWLCQRRTFFGMSDEDFGATLAMHRDDPYYFEKVKHLFQTSVREMKALYKLKKDTNEAVEKLFETIDTPIENNQTKFVELFEIKEKMKQRHEEKENELCWELNKKIQEFNSENYIYYRKLQKC